MSTDVTSTADASRCFKSSGRVSLEVLKVVLKKQRLDTIAFLLKNLEKGLLHIILLHHNFVLTLGVCLPFHRVFLAKNFLHMIYFGAGFMNRRRLCQHTVAILTSDLTTRMWVL